MKLLVALLLVAVVLIAGCTQYNNQPTTPPATTPPTPPSSNPSSYAVAIQNFAFNPASLSIKVGDTVVWTNMDSAAHTITADSGSEISSPPLLTGQSFSHTFNTAETLNYHCSIHTSMKGTITVV